MPQVDPGVEGRVAKSNSDLSYAPVTSGMTPSARGDRLQRSRDQASGGTHARGLAKVKRGHERRDRRAFGWQNRVSSARPRKTLMTRPLLVALLPFAVFASITSACSYDLCVYAPCGDAADGGSDSDDNHGAGAQGAGTSEGGGGSMPMLHCEFEEGETVDETCGVFVNAEFDGRGTGSKAAPYSTIKEAIATGSEHVYVCVGMFNEKVSVMSAQKLHGGYDCDDWRHTAAGRTQLTSPADTVPLTLEDGGTTVVEGFTVTAPNAEDEGGSSIAMVADNVNANLFRVELIAGNAEHGTSGGMGATGLGGNNGGSTTTLTVGLGGTSSCGAAGGRGGNGGTPTDGLPGLPNQDNEGTTSGASCTDGQTGAPPGTVGPGDDATIGSIGPAGYTPPVDSMEGETGLPGGGGGGGGGTTTGAGAGGAAGGCGGRGGVRGTSGGSSIAIVWLNANIDFVDCEAQVVGSAGDGGNGGPGGTGGPPGSFGTSTNGCDGGPGVMGGTGGPGGNGAGGHALVVAYLGEEPDLEGLDHDTPSANQAGSSDGLPGTAAIFLDFD